MNTIEDYHQKGPPSYEPHAIPIIVGVPVFGPHSCAMTCPSCNKAIVTETHTHAGLLSFTICGILLLFGL
ncbi:unnamed protein product [Brugia timori]|uniref:LITAF domain-containing protein n=1 Tax=Brugia timori TaxID=42155 RepID=A0A0R3QTW7_9BILA|nr:unnamed protein product [Brugia timori]